MTDRKSDREWMPFHDGSVVDGSVVVCGVKMHRPPVDRDGRRRVCGERVRQQCGNVAP